MSDEAHLGTTCFIPKRTYALLIAIGFTLYGVFNGLYFIVFFYKMQGKMTPTHCSGSRCSDLMTCDATLESTYHVRLIVLTLGSLVFGISGINAIHNKYGPDMFNFGCWLVFVVALLGATLFFDFSYLTVCSKHLSYNVIQEAVMWPIPNLPVHNGIKYEVGQMNSYPSAYVNALSNHNVFGLYAIWTLLKMAFFSHAAWMAFKLAERFHYGVAGMGANFSIEGWRQRLMMREEINTVAANTFGMALETCGDVDWREDEYLFSRQNKHKRYAYFGSLPDNIKDPGAYDGFKDDRRNVLL